MSDDSRWPSEVTRKRDLGGVMTIGAASAAAGAGTFTLFDASETSSNNTISAGTLNLLVGGSGSNAIMGLPNIEPGGSSKFDTPGWRDLDADGWATDGRAGQDAMLSDGKGATGNLYAFRDEDGDKVNIEDEKVRVTFDVTVDDRTKDYVPLIMRPSKINS